MFVKICGITRQEDYEFLLEKNISAAGFIAYPGSKRYISPENLKAIISKSGGNILKAGVFVDALIEDILKYVDAGINVIQLHGNEDASLALKLREYAEVWRALRPKTEKDLTDNIDYPASKILIDAYSEKMAGGTGIKADWNLAKSAVKLFKKPVILAGGLNTLNIEQAIKKVRPYGLDISSGVETSPGIKDRNAIEKIISIIQKEKHSS